MKIIYDLKFPAYFVCPRAPFRSLDISSRYYQRSVAQRGRASSRSFPENTGYAISYCESALRDRSLSELTTFRRDRIRDPSREKVWSRSGRKIRWNLACRVNIDVILAKWHDPHGCTIEIRIFRIKRALEGNDIACVIAERFYRSAEMYMYIYLRFLKLRF